MVYYATVKCNNKSFKMNQNFDISFLCLPRDEILRKQWIANLKRNNLPKPENIHICYIHFEDARFERDLEVKVFNL